MLINSLVLKGFRNLESCKLDTSYKQVILTGENGQGKTNLLEAIYMLCYGSSFRTQNLREVVSYDSEFFYLRSNFTDSDFLPRKVEFSYDKNNKTIKLDDKEIKDRKEIIYCLPCIVFSHDDIEFVRGEPENRRKFFDQTMTMYDPIFFDDLRKYRNTLRQRNAAIKDNRVSLLDIYDMKIASYGLSIMKAREKVCSSFSVLFPDIYEAVSQDNRKINISYRPSWSMDCTEEQIIEKLREQRETDLKMMTTTSGPHRDRFVITDKNGIFVSGASTGQMRLASLVFRSAQAAFFRQKTSLDPIFLIDDVLLELDSQKRARYLSYLGHYNQAFFTFLPEEKYFGSYFDLMGKDTKIYNVKEGKFS
ncbi:MAG: DNA replication/repair protein RecF [Sphaerochaetaceae bacterium]|nr:DNA replication/repair protein RecF [Sphaerochaetaceae bacterium]